MSTFNVGKLQNLKRPTVGEYIDALLALDCFGVLDNASRGYVERMREKSPVFQDRVNKALGGNLSWDELLLEPQSCLELSEFWMIDTKLKAGDKTEEQKL